MSFANGRCSAQNIVIRTTVGEAVVNRLTGRQRLTSRLHNVSMTGVNTGRLTMTDVDIAARLSAVS